MKTTEITPPSGSVCSLDAVKTFLRVGHGAEDGLVAELIAAATARVEAETGLALVSRVLKLTAHQWDGAALPLRPAPVTELVSVVVVDAEDGETDVTASYTVEHGRPAVFCRKVGAAAAVVPPGGRVEIIFGAGFGAAEDVPDDLVLAVKLYAAQVHGSRDGEVEPDSLLADLLRPWREMRL